MKQLQRTISSLPYLPKKFKILKENVVSFVSRFSLGCPIRKHLNFFNKEKKKPSHQMKKHHHFQKSSLIPSLLPSLEFFAFPSLTRSNFHFPFHFSHSSSHQSYQKYHLNLSQVTSLLFS